MQQRRLLSITTCLLFVAKFSQSFTVPSSAPSFVRRPHYCYRQQSPRDSVDGVVVVLLRQSSVSVEVVDAPPSAAVAAVAVPSAKAATTATCSTGQQVAQSASARHEVPLLQLALAGGACTFFADACIHPVDCIKTLQQIGSSTGIDGDVAEMNMVEAATRLYQTSGPRGFFHGLFTYAVSDAVGGALKFSFWEGWKKKFGNQDAVDASSQHWLVWPGAALAFLVASVAIVPGEFLKQQLQMSHYESLDQAVRGVWQNGGLGGFFVGYDAVVLRDVPHTMLELCLYDVFKRAGSLVPKNRGGQPRQVHPVLAACLTGCVAGFLTTPMDAIKTKLMMVEQGSGGCYYGSSSVWDCFATTLDSYGWEGLWAGALARVMWIAVSVSCCVVVGCQNE